MIFADVIVHHESGNLNIRPIKISLVTDIYSCVPFTVHINDSLHNKVVNSETNTSLVSQPEFQSP